MTRIALVSPYPPLVDGIGNHSASLVAAWEQAGHEVLVVTARSATPSTSSTSRVARILTAVPRRATTRQLAAFAPELVVVQFAISASTSTLVAVMAVCRWAQRRWIPVTVTYHEPARERDLLGPISRSIYAAMARRTTTSVVFSTAARDALVKAGTFPRIVELPLGGTPQVRPSAADVARVRARYCITRPLVLTMGFVHVDKGTEVLLDAAATISTALHGDVQFLLAGEVRARTGLFRIFGRRDRAYEARLHEQAAGLTDVHLNFCGFIPEEDAPVLLYLASAVVVPYTKITQSAVASLAASSGAAIIAADLCGLHGELGEAARYFPVGSPAGLSETAIDVLGDLDIQCQLRCAARRLSESKSFEQVATALEGTRRIAADQSSPVSEASPLGSRLATRADSAAGHTRDLDPAAAAQPGGGGANWSRTRHGPRARPTSSTTRLR